ncbi:MAG: aldose 1-epimerase [Alphaproteobacteria bacterium]|jgi:aldose 1-epimerase|nr:aldose 1-epimerase [Alphaproteobacteria bacterium]MCB1550858.1 aldose 1-epimerase [Alphaproteobacteria bacterium]MCB9984092.1 aldose 1-epimerase [Micavibrio sp.]
MQAKLHTIQNEHLLLEFCPEIGGIVTRFDLISKEGIIPLFRPYDPSLPLDPLNSSGFPLTPFSNRIGYGVLKFSGKTYRVGPSFGGEPHPNHGSGWHSVWHLTELSEYKAIMTLRVPKSEESPYDYEASQMFELLDDRLDITMTIKNCGEEALPFGTGHHTYFVRTPQTILRASLPKVWMSENMVPVELVTAPDLWNFENGRTFDPNHLEAKHGGDGSAYIDHCFAEWDQHAEITWPEFQNTTLKITADPAFRHFVIFVPSKETFFCAEPVTNATDGFNLMEKGIENTGTIVLQPNQTFSGTMHFTIA